MNSLAARRLTEPSRHSLPRATRDLESLAGELAEPSDPIHVGAFQPRAAEKIRMKLHHDRMDGVKRGSTGAIVPEIVGEIRTNEKEVAGMQRVNVVANPAVGAAPQNENQLNLRVKMPLTAEIPATDHLARHEILGGQGRQPFVDGFHSVLLGIAGSTRGGVTSRKGISTPSTSDFAPDCFAEDSRRFA